MSSENNDFLRSIVRQIKTVESEDRNPYMLLGEIKERIEQRLKYPERLK